VGQDTQSFKRALRRVLRQDPDVILVGEMRDEETVATALSAAETGHLVLSTLHTVDAPETVNRIIDFFPPHQGQQVRAMLARPLRPRRDGRGTEERHLAARLQAAGGGRRPALDFGRAAHVRVSGRLAQVLALVATAVAATGPAPAQATPLHRYGGTLEIRHTD